LNQQVQMRAGAGLTVTIDDEVVRVGYGEPDWFGPGRFRAAGGFVADGAITVGADDLGTFSMGEVARTTDGLVASVRAYADEPIVVFRLVAETERRSQATGTFDRPSVCWPHFQPGARTASGVPDGTRGFGHQYTEFAMPTQSDGDLARWFLLPFRPAVVEPLWLVAPDGRALMLAPLDGFHEQVIAVGGDGVDAGLRCGWHGDLDEIPAGFATELAVIAGRGVHDCLERWAQVVRRRAGTVRPGRYADALGRRPSYWTDNGSAYWYRTAPGHTVTETLVAAVSDLRDRGIPVGVVQLDSWWYPHDVLRPFDTEEWVVPPSGLRRWEAREDVLPDGIGGLRSAIGDPPLALHCRHLAAASPYLDDVEAWIDGDRAHPKSRELYERWLDQCLAWGAETFEHDWLIECFLGVRGLRAAPGRAKRWQEGIDGAAQARGLTLQWCMPSPADFFQSVTLRNVTSIRTSGDHGYLVSPGFLWAWFLYTNALARALGLWPFKDVFRSDTSNPANHSELEALLSALSGGPVAIGDEIGRADPMVVGAAVRADGLLLKPDVPVAAIDRCFHEHAVARPALLVGECFTDQPAGRWHYVVTINAYRGAIPLTGRVALGDLGVSAEREHVVWDWRSGTAAVVAPGEAWAVELAPEEWDYRVVAPVLSGGVAVIGAVAAFVTAADRRLRVHDRPDGVEVVVTGSSGEEVSVVAWSAARGTWTTTVVLPATGWTTLRV
jgi:hypothetical protein